MKRSWVITIVCAVIGATGIIAAAIIQNFSASTVSHPVQTSITLNQVKENVKRNNVQEEPKGCCSEPAKSVFPFEMGITGWLAQDCEDSRACTRVSQSEENAKTGRYSLRLDFDLCGGDAQRGNGEAWIIMSDNPPAGKSIPVDLTNRTVTAWVFAPATARGDRSKPNGFQIFVKDKNWKSEYGRWYNIVEGQWVKISLTVSGSRPVGGYMDAEFDPSKIVALGVKLGAGEGSTRNYKGPVFLDDVDF